MTAPNTQQHDDEEQLRAGVRRLIEAKVPEEEIAAFIQRHARRAPTLGEKISGTFGSLFPIGSAGESLQAGVRMVGSRIPILNQRTGGPQNFREALADIQAAKRDAPALARGAAGLVGQGVQAAALPGSVVTQGLLSGALEGLGGSERDWTDAQGRVSDAVGHAVTNAILGKTLEGVSGGVRSGGQRLASTAKRVFGREAQGAAAAAENVGGDVAEQVARGGVSRASRAERRAALEAIKKMAPEEARAARAGYLDEMAGQLGRSLIPHGLEGGAGILALTHPEFLNPKLAGVLALRRLVTTTGRAAGPLRALDEAAGGVQLQDLANLLGISLGSPVSRALQSPGE